MTEYKLEPEYVKILNCYSNNRVIKIKGENNYYDNPTGVPQGSALGPPLMMCVIISIFSTFYKLTIHAKINYEKTEFMLFSKPNDILVENNMSRTKNRIGDYKSSREIQILRSPI